MAKTLRKSMFYGILLVAGVTLGMQMSETGAGQNGFQQNGIWTANGWQAASSSNGAVNGPFYQTQSGQAGNVNPYANGQYNNGQYNIGGNGNPNNNGNQSADGVSGVSPSQGSTAQNWTSQGGYNWQTSGYDMLQTPGDLLLPEPAAPAVDRFADKAANLLQQASRKSIHWFASLFGPSTE
ncbi:hypothetical protein DFP94_101317 [Fontibacillus phaseoli]|uniref:Uncharacterized protein n=1 Tax=Fontibacillus phaseoli TaxID=1416533 RepID=A0A369BSZ6_9BACL|nr:hypothetical protein [Fontibacillus phaseoli]RCX22734.1 hypothetical protein DFP94_101317 [Fontibacillus phaseoli]